MDFPLADRQQGSPNGTSQGRVMSHKGKFWDNRTGQPGSAGVRQNGPRLLLLAATRRWRGRQPEKARLAPCEQGHVMSRSCRATTAAERGGETHNPSDLKVHRSRAPVPPPGMPSTSTSARVPGRVVRRERCDGGCYGGCEPVPVCSPVEWLSPGRGSAAQSGSRAYSANGWRLLHTVVPIATCVAIRRALRASGYVPQQYARAA
jgi:hypothetical protein